MVTHNFISHCLHLFIGPLPTKNDLWCAYLDLIDRGYTEVLPQGGHAGYMRPPPETTTSTTSGSPSPPETTTTTTSGSLSLHSPAEESLLRGMQHLREVIEHLQSQVEQFEIIFERIEEKLTPLPEPTPEELDDDSSNPTTPEDDSEA